MNAPYDRGLEALRTPPHSIEAESSILGGLLLDNSRFDVIGDLLTERDFYRMEHRSLWTAITGLILANRPADVLTVHEQLRRNGTDVDLSMSYLSQLAQFVPSLGNMRRYAEIVREKALRRRMAAAADEIAALAMGDGQGFDELSERATGLLTAITQDGPQSDEWVDIGAETASMVDSMQSRIDGSAPDDFIPTGLKELDDQLNGGLRPGHLVVVGARPGMGKTALSLSIGANMGRAGNPVAMFSMEMPRREVLERLVSMQSRIHLSRIQRPERLHDYDWGRLADGIEVLRKLNFHVSDMGGLNIHQLRAKARTIQRKSGVRLLIVDYLGLMAGSDPKAMRTYQIEEITKGLKALSKELNLPVLLLVQLSREVEKRTDQMPILSDLRDSGSVEQDADEVIFIHRPANARPELSKENKDWDYVAKVSIAKQRNGPQGTRDLMYLGENTLFLDWPDSMIKPQRQRTDSRGGGL